ncbi:MAG: GNAT family N-acetyltransferase [SAR202 cluster bacterium]|nr:GNAT family N-acetyltransferase [SAR202 cluster bacterium]
MDARWAGPADIDAVMDLVMGLRRHLASAPAFLPLVVESDPTKIHEARLADPANALWLTYVDREAIGLATCTPPTPPNDRLFPVALRGDGSACGIGGGYGGAFVRNDVRGSGIGKALLNHVMSWARDAGYDRCALDYEPANIEAERSWSGQGFELIVNSLTRTIDPRIAWANSGRTDADLWRRW